MTAVAYPPMSSTMSMPLVSVQSYPPPPPYSPSVVVYTPPPPQPLLMPMYQPPPSQSPSPIFVSPIDTSLSTLLRSISTQQFSDGQVGAMNLGNNIVITWMVRKRWALFRRWKAVVRDGGKRVKAGGRGTTPNEALIQATMHLVKKMKRKAIFL